MLTAWQRSKELAGELRESLPDLKVTLIHRGRALMNNAYPDKYRNSLLEMLQKGGVEVILGDSLVNESPERGGTVTTLSGREISADLIVSIRSLARLDAFTQQLAR